MSEKAHSTLHKAVFPKLSKTVLYVFFSVLSFLNPLSVHALMATVLNAKSDLGESTDYPQQCGQITSNIN